MEQKKTSKEIMAQHLLSLVKDIRYIFMKSVSSKKDEYKTTIPKHIIVKWLIIVEENIPSASKYRL